MPVTIALTLLVKDEVDIIESNLLWHRSLGIDHILVTDNGSTDGTLEILQTWERAGNLTLVRNDGPYRQDILMTEMAHKALELWNPSWVISDDADELFAPRIGSLKDELEASPHSLLFVPMTNFMPTAYDDLSVADPFCRIQHKVVKPLPIPRIPELLKVSPMGISGKVIVRPQHLKKLQFGNTSAQMTSGTAGRSTNLVVNHFSVRSREHFFGKVIKGAAAFKTIPEYDKNLGYHWRRWYRQYEAGKLEAEWRRLCPGKFMTNMLKTFGVVERDRNITAQLNRLKKK
jgi:glycosyltransferase involved in cell wall biosynthesis